ncbi:MAG: hypothetical protein AB1611_09520 [bacterium]
MRTLFIRMILTLAALIFLAFSSLAGFAGAQVNLGVSLGDEGLQGFYLAVGDYYQVPQKEVIVIRERQIPDEEIPVVLLIAKRARVAPQAVMDLRLGGRTWMDITLHFGLSPEIFYIPARTERVYYVPVIVEKGPPHGKAHGHYRKIPKGEWNRVVLKDADVVNLVNLKFVSEHYHLAPDEVVKIREQGNSYVEINNRLKKAGREPAGGWVRKESEKGYTKGGSRGGHKEEMKAVKHKGKGKGKG